MSTVTQVISSPPLCNPFGGLASDTDVVGIAVVVASKFSLATGSFLSDPNSVLLVSDVVANLCFRAFLHLHRYWLG